MQKRASRITLQLKNSKHLLALNFLSPKCLAHKYSVLGPSGFHRINYFKGSDLFLPGSRVDPVCGQGLGKIELELGNQNLLISSRVYW